MSEIVLRAVEKFAEPEFTQLLDVVFAESERRVRMEQLFPPTAEQRERKPEPVERMRIGAFDGERLVGWSHGWHEPGGTLYVQNSAVLPEYRRQGIYTRLLDAVREHAAARGCLRITSSHRAENPAVLIAKLKAGYTIVGTEFGLDMGLLLKMALYLAPDRAAFFSQRIGPAWRLPD